MAKILFKAKKYKDVSFNEQSERESFFRMLDENIRTNHNPPSALAYAAIAKRKFDRLCIYHKQKKLRLKCRDSIIIDTLKQVKKSLGQYKFIWYHNRDGLFTKQERLDIMNKWNKSEDRYQKYLLENTESKYIINNIHKYNEQYKELK